MKNLKVKAILVSLLCILLAGVAPQVSLGGEPVSPCDAGNPVFVGPPIPGYLTFVNSKPDEFLGMVTFLGTCDKQLVTKKFCFGTDILPVPFGDLTKDNLINLVLGDFGPPECCSFCGGEALIIANVKRFRNTGQRITAEVVLRCFTCP